MDTLKKEIAQVLLVAVFWGGAAWVVQQPDFDRILEPPEEASDEDLDKMLEDVPEVKNGQKEGEAEAAGAEAGADIPVPKMVSFIDIVTRFYGKENVRFIDARDRGSFEAGHIPGALHIDAEDLDGNPMVGQEVLEPLSRKMVMIVYCSGGKCDLSKRLVPTRRSTCKIIIRKRAPHHALQWLRLQCEPNARARTVGVPYMWCPVTKSRLSRYVTALIKRNSCITARVPELNPHIKRGTTSTVQQHHPWACLARLQAGRQSNVPENTRRLFFLVPGPTQAHFKARSIGNRPTNRDAMHQLVGVVVGTMARRRRSALAHPPGAWRRWRSQGICRALVGRNRPQVGLLGLGWSQAAPPPSSH